MNARSPAAVKITTRTSRSAPRAVNVDVISTIVALVTAFTGGRSSVTVATWSTTSTVGCSILP